MRLEAKALQKANSLQWAFSIPPAAGVVEEDPFIVKLKVKKPDSAPASIVDVQKWDGEGGLEPYLPRSVWR